MRRLKAIAAGTGVVIAVVGLFVTTQIADSQGRTMVDRVPVLGTIVRLVTFADPVGDAPLVMVYDGAAAL